MENKTFNKILKNKILKYSLLKSLYFALLLFSIVNIFFKFNLILIISLIFVYSIFLIYFLFNKKKSIILFDKISGSKGLLISAFEFCNFDIPGSEELKEKSIKISEKILKNNNIYSEFKNKLIKICLILSIIIFIPRFSKAPKNFFNIKIIAPTDTILFYGDSLKVKIFSELDFNSIKVFKDTCNIIINKDFLQIVNNDTSFFYIEADRNDFTYKIIINDSISFHGNIEVISPPLLIDFIRIIPPSYTESFEYTTSLASTLSVLEKSQISISLKSSVNIIKWITNDSIINYTERTANIISLIDSSKFEKIKAITIINDTISIDFFVQSQKDNAPICNIISPLQRNFKIGFFSEIKIKVETFDDFKLTNSGLLIKNKNNIDKIFDLFIDEKGPVILNYSITPNLLSIGPGETAFISCIVYDNFIIPQRSITTPIKVIFPTLTEIYSIFDSTNTSFNYSTENIKNKGTALLFQMEILKQRFTLQDSLSLQDKNEFNSLINEHKELTDQLFMQTENMQNALKNLLITSTTDSLIIDKAQKISELIDNIFDEETKAAFDKLYQLSQDLKEDNYIELLENLRENSEELLERLDKALNILKQLELQRKLEELIKRSLDISNTASEFSENLNNLQKKQLENINSELSDISKEINKLINENISSDIQGNLSQALEESYSAQESAEEMLENNNLSSELMQSLTSMTENLQQAAMTLSSNKKDQINSLLNNIINNLLSLSELEERFFHENLSLDLSIASFRSITKIKIKYDSLKEFTMLINPLLEIKLEEIYDSLFAVKTNDSHKYIMKLVNDAILIAERQQQQFNNNICNNNSSNTMQGLSQLAGDQANLNAQTQQASQGQGQPMFSGASTQRAISERLSEIVGEMSGSGNILNELEEIIKEMELSSLMLENEDISRELIERQRNILQKLLDNQRALRQQEERPIRKAEFAEDQLPYPFISGIDNIFNFTYIDNINNIPISFNYNKNPFYLYLIKKYENIKY